MQEEAFASEIRWCTQAQDVNRGKNVHCTILLTTSTNNRYLSNLLLQMYGTCNRPVDAACLFDHIPHPNIFSWNLLLAAYAHNGHLLQAALIFNTIPNPDTVSFNTLISAYSTTGSISQARALFDQIPSKNTISWNAIVTAYAQNGHLRAARYLFNQTPFKNTASWNIMLSSYARAGHKERAKEVFDRMPRRNVVSWTAMLCMYAEAGELHRAEALFDRMPERSVVSWTTMVHGYARNGHVEKAREVFASMPRRSSVSWSVMLLAYAQAGYMKEAEIFFKSIPDPGVVCWNALLQARINSSSSVEECRSLFEKMPQRDVVSWTSMVTAYARCGNIDEAEKLFNKMPVKNTVSWNVMISAYAENGRFDKAEELFHRLDVKPASAWTAMMLASDHKQALRLFKLMDQEGVQPDVATYTAVLTISSLVENTDSKSSPFGRLIHSEFLHSNLEPDVALGNSLINFYSSCNCMQQAETEFDKMNQHDVKSWTCLISGYTRNKLREEAVKVFARMDQAGFHPDNFTFVAVYEACGGIACSGLAKVLHSAFETSRNTADIVVENALVDLYGKCGSLYESRAVFQQMRERDLVSWSTLVTACVHNGEPQEALEFFCLMIMEGYEPDHVNFVAVLTACSHLGEIERASQFFVSISYDYHLQNLAEHYHCMVDSLARAGKVKEAEEVVMAMPFVPGDVAQMSVLAACKTQGNTPARTCPVDSNDSAPYVMLSNALSSY